MRRLPLLLVAVFLPGCVVAALGLGAAAGILVHQAAVADDSVEAVYRATLDAAFDASIAVMDEMSLETIHSRRDRLVRGEVGGAEVRIQIRPLEEKKGEIAVTITARKNYLADRDTALRVFQKINLKLTAR